jgi:hypothetical protein
MWKRECNAREGTDHTSIHTGESGCAEGRGMFEALDLALEEGCMPARLGVVVSTMVSWSVGD